MPINLGGYNPHMASGLWARTWARPTLTCINKNDIRILILSVLSHIQLRVWNNTSCVNHKYLSYHLYKFQSPKLNIHYTQLDTWHKIPPPKVVEENLISALPTVRGVSDRWLQVPEEFLREEQVASVYQSYKVTKRSTGDGLGWRGEPKVLVDVSQGLKGLEILDMLVKKPNIEITGWGFGKMMFLFELGECLGFMWIFRGGKNHEILQGKYRLWVMFFLVHFLEDS